MNEIVQWIAAWLPFGAIVGGILMGLVISFASALVWPRYLMLVFLAIFILAPNESSWAMRDASAAFNVYDKGQKFLFFPFLQVYLWGLWLSVQLRFGVSGERGLPSPLGIWFLAFAALIVGQVIFAAATDESVLTTLSRASLMNILNMGIAFSLMLQLFVTEKNVESLERWFLIVFAGRMVWGAVRFVALGGDPMNVYEVRENIPVRITFFDINDNLLACAALFLAAWRLSQGGAWRGRAMQWFYVLVIVLGLFTIVFSFRRTMWAGLILATVVLLTSRHWPHRAATAGAVAFLGIPAVLLVAFRRFSESSHGGGLIAQLFPDVVKGGRVAYETGRFAKLTAMLRSVGDNWLWGLGSWGEFAGRFYADVAYHGGNYGYGHSGFGHIYMKAGLVGIVLFCGLLGTFVAFAIRHRNRIEARFRPIFEMSLAASVFSLAPFVGGTSVIELRTMVLIGVFLSLPFMVVGLQSKEPASP